MTFNLLIEGLGCGSGGQIETAIAVVEAIGAVVGLDRDNASK